MSILLTLIVIGILVIVHEGGHYLAARKFGVKVEKFSIGFGQKIISFVRDETEFVIAWIPLGGFVKMKGENPDDKDFSQDSFFGKSWWQRAIIAFSGPFANFLFALAIFIISFMVGHSMQDQQPIVGKVTGEYQSFFQPGDRITEVNDEPVRGWNDIALKTIKDHNNKYTYIRNGQSLTVTSYKLTRDNWLRDLLPYVPAKVGDVNPGMPAYRAGLQPSDVILAVDSVTVKDWYAMRERIVTNPSQHVMLTIQRGKTVFNKKLDLDVNVLAGQDKLIGITQYSPVSYKTHASVMESIENGSLTTISFIALNYYALYKLILKPEELKKNIGGPIMLVTMSQQSAQKGFDTILVFIASISLILMIMNLLPIPILDGGHIFFNFIEGIRGKPLPLKTQTVLQQIGFSFLLLLMFYAFYADVSRLFARFISLKGIKPY